MSDQDSYTKDWKSFLGEVLQVVGGNNAALYHFAKTKADSLLLDPAYFLSQRSTFSRNEYEKSQVPRVFFYVDPTEVEQIVRPGRTLYSVEVSADDIYDLSADPDEIKKASVQPGAFFVDYNRVFETIKQDYKGAYYRTPNFGVVVWFEPIEVQSLKEEE